MGSQALQPTFTSFQPLNSLASPAEHLLLWRPLARPRFSSASPRFFSESEKGTRFVSGFLESRWFLSPVGVCRWMSGLVISHPGALPQGLQTTSCCVQAPVNPSMCFLIYYLDSWPQTFGMLIEVYARIENKYKCPRMYCRNKQFSQYFSHILCLIDICISLLFAFRQTCSRCELFHLLDNTSRNLSGVRKIKSVLCTRLFRHEGSLPGSTNELLFHLLSFMQNFWEPLSAKMTRKKIPVRSQLYNFSKNCTVSGLLPGTFEGRGCEPKNNDWWNSLQPSLHWIVPC